MSYNFLDKTGLTYLWGKIKAYIGNKTIPLINGTQTASTSAWTGVAPFSELVDGQVINFYLPFASTDTAVTLNLTLSDGTTTGALPVYYSNGTERMTTHFGRGSTMALMYRASRVNSSGTTITNSWYFFSNRDTNSINQLRIENGCIYAGTNGIKKYALCALDSDSKYQSFTTTSGNGTTKTINTSAKFLSPMTIYQNNSNADYASGAKTGNYPIYNAGRVDLRYSCNNYNNFVLNKPLYLECTKDADGFLSVTSNVMVQSGFVGGNYYVYLGEICNDVKYVLQLFPQHPTFYYTGQFFVDIVDWKVDKVDGMGLSECNYTTTDKNKLAGIEDNATRVIVDSAFSSSSTNAIQNKLVYSTFQSFANNVDNNFAKLASPTFTGTPKAPTATAGTNTTQIATTAFVQTAVSGKQDTLATQTAYSAKGTSTKVPQITTNTLGQVTGITEVNITYPTVDSSLSSASTNAIQNKAVNTAILGLSRDIAQVEEGLTEDLTTKQDTLTSATDITVGSATLSKTSYNYNGGAIPGTKLATVTTVPNLIDEVRYTNGQMGSVQILTAYTLSAVTIPTGWYNYQYIPHRYGGIDGEQPSTDADNVIYGTLILYGMTANQGITYKINVNSSNRYLVAPEVYTTNDQVIGRWIDGKILYRKIIQFTPTVQNGNINHGISNLNQVVRIGGMFQRGTTKVFNPLPNNYTNWEAFIYDVSDTKFTYRFSANQWSAGVGQCYVWIEFTKTT